MKMFRSESHQEINSELNEALVLLKHTGQLEKVGVVFGAHYILVLPVGVKQITDQPWPSIATTTIL